MTILIFLAVLLVCVIAHEWGHFIVARKSGMLVEEFGFGIPPRLWSKTKGETRYSVNAFPIGGFVKIAGENGLDESIPAHRQFETKPWYLKAAVLVAGVVMNILLAIALFALSYMLGMPTIVKDGTPTVVSLSPGAPAARAGIAVGDTVERVAVDGVAVSELTTEALRPLISESAQRVSVSYVHDGEAREAVLTPEGEAGSRMIGVGIEPIGIAKVPFFQALRAAWQQTWQLVGAIWHTLGSLVGGLFTADTASISGLIGPVGLAGEVKSAATIGFTYLLAFTAVISVNLAVLNIMPFPALDGGRLLVVLLEAVLQRKFSRTVIGYIHAAGFLLLIGLMVVLTVGDIRRIF